MDFGTLPPPATADTDIVYWFRVTSVPLGGAPLRLRQRWIGVPLPVRRPRPIEGPESYVGHDVVDRAIVRSIPDGVAINPYDAAAALRFFGEHEAAEWWEDFTRQRPMTTALVFRRSEGELLPSSLALRLYPELADFGKDPNE